MTPAVSLAPRFPTGDVRRLDWMYLKPFQYQDSADFGFQYPGPASALSMGGPSLGVNRFSIPPTAVSRGATIA